MRIILFFIFCISFPGFSQFGFDKIEHDYGDIYAGNDRVVDLKFRNTSNEKVYLLRVKHDREVRTLVSAKTIMPDSMIVIRVKYNPTKTGKFKKRIPVYLSNSMEPFIFTIEGNVREIDNSMGLACPTFENKDPNQALEFKFKGLVLDAETKEPIKDASITFVSNGMVSQIEKTNRNGKVTTNSILGLYYFVISADGYIIKEFPKYINRNNDSIMVYLEKPEELITEEPVVIEKEEVEVADTLAKTLFEFPLDTIPLAKTEPKIEEDSLEKKLVIYELDTTTLKENEPIIKQKDSVVLVEKKEPILLEKDTTPVEKEKPKKVSYKSNNIVFLLDVSTSMNKDGKLDLLKASLIEMVQKLSPNDRITLISYATFTNVIIGGTAGSEKEALIKAIQGIKASGMTAGGDGMKFAYRQAKKYFIEGGNNQVIMATDGKFNQGNTNLGRLVEKNYENGIGLTVLGIKNKPEDAQEMSSYANMGGGRFLLIDSYEDSKEMLIEEIKRASRVYE